MSGHDSPIGGRPPDLLSQGEWRRLEPLVDALLDTPLRQRAALLADLSGGDPARQLELERLVSECERAHPLLDRPAAERFGALVDDDALSVSQVVADRYRITRTLRRGGMATVYLARDLRHGRDVAVKVVRAELATSLGSERFLREIEIVAGLHHPHIVALYDSGAADGVLYYVMPYEAGQSLRERLARDGLVPIDDAVAILRDVCDALAYAHEHGIVHRDIKPDNVLLSGRHAMVTDFGVAKALSAAVGGSERPERAEPTRVLTASGITVGTPAYMAPEQIAGDPRIDHRADIYAVGVLAYEILTGRPPFQCEEPHEVRAAHLSRAPTLLTTQRPEVPAELDAVVMKCLAKRPADRWQSADELLSRLESFQTPGGVHTVSPAADASPAPPPAPTPLAPTRRRRAVRYAMIPVAILMTGAAIWGWMRPSPSKPVVRYTLVVDSAQAIAGGEPWSGRVALSPDGSHLAYIGGPRLQLLIRPFNQLRAIAVPGTEGATTPFFSPDGSQVGYLKEEKIRIMSIRGRRPISVSDTLTGVAGASWGPDNSIYVDGAEDAGLLRVQATEGSKPSWFTVLDTASGEYDHNWPDVLPNGKGVLFTVGFRRTGAKGTISHAIAVADIPSGKHRVLVDDAMYPRYSASGHLLYVTTNKTLMVVPFDQNSMRVTGEPTALTEGMRLGLYGSADLAVSATGTLIYTTGAGGNHELVWATRDGRTQPVDPDWQGGILYFPALSPDGKWVAVARNSTTEPIHIWIKRLDRGESRKLTLEGKTNINPTWTPDGRSVTFSSETEMGSWDLWTKRADGSAQEVLQLRAKRSLFGPRWSPDGTWLIFQTDPAQPGAGDILGLRPGIDTVPVPLVVTKFTEVAPALSPNGRWLAYVSNETGRFETYVVPFPNTGAAKWAISPDGGTEPLWSHGGNELFYRDASLNFVAVELKTKPTFSVGRSTVLFSAAAFDAYDFAPMYAVAADDRRFIISRPAETGAPDKVIVVENWFEELRAKSPK